MYEPLSAFLLRAPLLPERELTRAARALAQHPLGARAIELASASLAAAKETAAKRKAFERYGKRAAVRATPQGLLAGVCVGELAERTQIATGTPRAWLAPTWERMAALGRALLEDEGVRERVRLRVAPSLVRGTTTARWLGPGEPFVEQRVVALDDERLASVIDESTERFVPWSELRAAADGDDDLLLLLVDYGLLQPDLTPPLVGPPPPAWMRARLAALGLEGEALALDAALEALAAGDLAGGAAALAALPGAREGAAGVQGVLVHEPARPPRLARAAVERAAALAPLLFRLQDALAPPASERLAQPALDAALEAATEVHGAGALSLEALAAGDYGVSPGQDDEGPADGETAGAAPAPALLSVLVDALVEAARAGRDVADLDVAALAAACDGVGPAPPPTCELFLAPTPRPRGAPEGTGWLLGLHAPAGASWGRFAAALGAPLARALGALAQAEAAARPHEEALDVAFAPSPAHADLCAHPPVRRRALALTSWPEASAEAPLALRDLSLVAAPGAAVPLALRAAHGGGPLAPSPLSRVRSTTAPAGVPRLLAGWSLYRQHTPWALALGPLAALTRVPRLALDGFVVAPASWAVPAPADRPLTRAGLRRWRGEAHLPRWVQVGHEDQLLPVDLDAADAPAALAGHERVWEIWPPLGSTVDRDGRRIEAVVALVARPDAEEAQSLALAARAVAAAGSVPPPRLAPPSDYVTFKLFGAREHQEAVLVGAVGPAVAAALDAREISGWFFQRYVDGPGQRHHLRVRVRTAGPEARAAFEARLSAALAPTRAAGDVTTVEAADYHPEYARWGAALDAVHAIFEADSELALSLLAEDDDAPMVSLVGALDALARGLGLDLPARLALARARRAAEESLSPPDDDARDEVDAELRTHARALRALLGGADPRAAAFAAHAARVARAAGPGEAAALAPALLHLTCVRLAGPDRDLERRAYTLWSRTLEGLLKSSP